MKAAIRGHQQCDACHMNTLHEHGVCKVCTAKIEEQARIDRKLAALKTVPEKLGFLMREIFTDKTMDAGGHIRTLRKPTMRGRGAKNIARILRTGKRRLAEAKVKGVDLTVLPPESKIRKRAEADWKRLVNPPPPRGNAGRLAARVSTSKRKKTNRDRAIALRDEGKTISEIATIINRDERTIRRYLNGPLKADISKLSNNGLNR